LIFWDILYAERKLVKSLAEYIEDNEFREMNKIVRKRLKKWTKASMKVAVVGQSRSGKTSLIHALLGKNTDMEYRYMDHSLKTQEYSSSLNRNLTISEITLPESNRIRDEFLKEMNFSDFDFVILVTSTWFTETSMWITSYSQNNIIRYKSPSTQNPFGLLYRLDKCFSDFCFIHRTLQPDKIYHVKNNLF